MVELGVANALANGASKQAQEMRDLAKNLRSLAKYCEDEGISMTLESRAQEADQIAGQVEFLVTQYGRRVVGA